MKHFLTTLLCTFLYIGLYAQTAPVGVYYAKGYFFHPTSNRAFSGYKYITQISTNVFQVDLGDLGSQSYSFQFTVGANNKLINWTPVGATPALPSSGFMTADDPGFSCPGYPDTTRNYKSTLYNNTFDPVTQTFYMHYGYGVGSTGQNGFSRQVYEKYIFMPPPKITSVYPLTGTTGTKIAIKGTHLVNLFGKTAYSSNLTFGGAPPDSVISYSDTSIELLLDNGASGTIKVENNFGADSVNGFVYNPVPVVTKPLWNNVGNLNLSTANSHEAAIAVNSNNVPYVVYSDSSSAIWLCKFEAGRWIKVGDKISDSTASHPKIVIDQNNNPYVSYVDSANNSLISMKMFDGTNWNIIGTLGFSSGYNGNYYIAMDSLMPYVASIDTNLNYGVSSYGKYLLSILKYNGNKWDSVGSSILASIASPYCDIAIDKKKHIPYIIYRSADSLMNSYYMALPVRVRKFDGIGWQNVGNYFVVDAGTDLWGPLPYANKTTIVIDGQGNPIVSYSMDLYEDRQSSFIFVNGDWKLLGNFSFSNCHAYEGSIIIDNKNKPYVLFQDYSYNKQGSVMQLDTVLNKWNYAGARGFAAFDSASFSRQSLAIDSADNPIIAFVNKDLGNSISVMSLGNKLQVNGRVITASQKALPSANMNISGDYTSYTKTDSNGNYTVPLIQTGDYTFNPTKNNDINKTNGITTLDMALVQSHVLGKNMLKSPYKLIAADVNGDGKLTTLDIVYMKRLILGLDTTFTNTTNGQKRLWAFVDSSYSFPDTTNPFPFKDSISYVGLSANKVNQTFIGVKLGDVNWDWNPLIAKMPSPVFIKPKKLIKE